MICRRQLASNARLKRAAVTARTAAAARFAEECWERFMWRDAAKALRELWQTSGAAGGAYRPDLHYMRGPGPKWHAKYGGLVTKSSTAATPPRAIWRELVERRA
jgi:hypothetical protein